MMEITEEKTNNSPKPVRQMPSWLRGFMRRGLIILVAFTLGAILIALVFYLPLQQDYKEVSNQLDNATADIADLTDQVDELSTQNEDLQQSLDAAGLQLSITSALAEVREAHLAIIANDPAGARLAVTQAIQSLSTLSDLIDKENSDIVTNMLEKANQANIDLQTDLTSALPALEQLDKNLVSLFNTLFPSP
jgi:chromosome segregation ATPase